MNSRQTINPRSEKFYDSLYFLYPIIEFFLKPQKKKFFDTINEYPHGRLLEIGVGNGRDLKYYRKHAITSIDTSRAMLNKARKYQKTNVHLLQMNGESLVFRNHSFDYVILSHVVSVVDDPQRLMREVCRVLKPGGRVFILNHFTPSNSLRYLDQAFSFIAPALHFKSVFHIASLDEPENLQLTSTIDTDVFSYFKILIYEKTV